MGETVGEREEVGKDMEVVLDGLAVEMSGMKDLRRKVYKTNSRKAAFNGRGIDSEFLAQGKRPRSYQGFPWRSMVWAEMHSPPPPAPG